ncbi:MAG: 4Fe-4S binding protein [Clostridia bacterium]|nr:4Fe-4S binding protein [Clostridia bacterium]
MVDDKICIGCGTCINMCPVGAISFDKNGKAKIDPKVCIKCKTCQGVCPVSAITIKED